MAINLKSALPPPSPPPEEPVQSVAPAEEEVKIVKIKSAVKPESELAEIIKAMHKNKPGTVLYGNQIPQVLRIPTGMFEFDFNTGGGFPRGRYSIVYGPESSGKSNACYCAAAQAQRLPDPCNKVVWVDLEGTFDAAWAEQFGIDTSKLIVAKPDYGEEAVDMMQAFVHAEDVALLVLDSLAVVVSAKELEQSVEKFDVGTAPTLVKRMCNKLVIGLSEESKRGHFPAVILINQTRFKIGVMFGNPETMPGGQAMKFASSLTIRISGKNKIEKSVNPDLATFKETSAVIKKAKVPITKLEFDYDMCVLKHDTLNVGETRSWSLVSNYLKQTGELKNLGPTKGWYLLGKQYPTLVVIQDTYEAEQSFAMKLQKMVIDAHKDSMFITANDV